MNIELKKESTEVLEKATIVVDGQDFGRVEEWISSSGKRSYMAVVNIVPGSGGDAYGHGDTKEAAIADAIENARHHAHKMLGGLAQFERLIHS